MQLPPAATTGSAQPITATTATISGTVNPLGADTTATFQYGTTPALGSTTPAINLAAAGTATTVTTTLTSLPRGRTIYYQLTATNVAGTTSGDTRTFSTAGAPQDRVIKVRFDNQLITLTTPLPAVCTATNQAYSVILTSTTIRKSRAPKLHFKHAATYLGRIDRRDRKKLARHLPAVLTLALARLRPGTHTLEVVLSYEKRHRRKSHTVTKTVKAGFSVC